MHKEEYEVLPYSETLKTFLLNILFFGLLCGVLLEISNWIHWLAIAGFTLYVLFAFQSTIRSGLTVIGSSRVAFSDAPPSLKRWIRSFVMSIESVFMVGCSLLLYTQLF